MFKYNSMLKMYYDISIIYTASLLSIIYNIAFLIFCLFFLINSSVTITNLVNSIVINFIHKNNIFFKISGCFLIFIIIYFISELLKLFQTIFIFSAAQKTKLTYSQLFKVGIKYGSNKYPIVNILGIIFAFIVTFYSYEIDLKENHSLLNIIITYFFTLFILIVHIEPSDLYIYDNYVFHDHNFKLALVYYDNKYYKKALEYLEKSEKNKILEYVIFPLHQLRAQAHFFSDEYELAIANLDITIDNINNDKYKSIFIIENKTKCLIDAYKLKVIAYLQLKDFKSANECMDKLLEISPNDIEIRGIKAELDVYKQKLAEEIEPF